MTKRDGLITSGQSGRTERTTAVSSDRHRTTGARQWNPAMARGRGTQARTGPRVAECGAQGPPTARRRREARRQRRIVTSRPSSYRPIPYGCATHGGTRRSEYPGTVGYFETKTCVSYAAARDHLTQRLRQRALGDGGGPDPTPPSPGAIAYASAAVSASSQGASTASPGTGWTFNARSTPRFPKGSGTDGYLYFYSHRGRGGWLSQFYDSPFVSDGATFETAEKFMMASKARLMGDEAAVGHIMATTKPEDAKELGRRIVPWDEALWQAERFGIVSRGTELKFSQNPQLREWLLQTGDTTLVEASPHDEVWGIGLSIADAETGAQWRGTNLLGRALGVVRKKFRAADAAADAENTSAGPSGSRASDVATTPTPAPAPTPSPTPTPTPVQPGDAAAGIRLRTLERPRGEDDAEASSTTTPGAPGICRTGCSRAARHQGGSRGSLDLCCVACYDTNAGEHADGYCETKTCVGVAAAVDHLTQRLRQRALGDGGGPDPTPPSPGAIAYASAAVSASSLGASTASPGTGWTFNARSTPRFPKGSGSNGSLYFYSHRGRGGWLSQFYESPFVSDGATFETAEKVMMASKARLMGDEAAVGHIMATTKPEDAKELGRRIVPWDEALWQAERFGIVTRGAELKFSQNPQLREWRLQTDDTTLVEASPHGKAWGIGLSIADAEKGAKWRGTNLLGRALGVVREKFRAADAAADTEDPSAGPSGSRASDGATTPTPAPAPTPTPTPLQPGDAAAGIRQRALERPQWRRRHRGVEHDDACRPEHMPHEVRPGRPS